MTLRDKVIEYLKTHKKPATTRQIANYYIAAVSSVATVFRELEKDGLATVQTIGGKHYWSYNRVSEIKAKDPVAVSEPVAPPQSSRSPAIVLRQRPIQNSYPHTRGYDD